MYGKMVGRDEIGDCGTRRWRDEEIRLEDIAHMINKYVS